MCGTAHDNHDRRTARTHKIIYHCHDLQKYLLLFFPFAGAGLEVRARLVWYVLLLLLSCVTYHQPPCVKILISNSENVNY